MSMPNTPHGGRLIEGIVPDEGERIELLAQAEKWPSIVLDPTAQADFEMLSDGGLSPLAGFMGQEDFRSVLKEMRLENGLPWTIPIVLGADRETAAVLPKWGKLALRMTDGQIIGFVDVAEIFPHDAATHARSVFGTADENHPGAKRVHAMGEFLIAGNVTRLRPKAKGDYGSYDYTPRQLREVFRERGWKTVVAFQTRNPIHRAHEYLMKCALESTDGLLLHPLVGHTKEDDLPTDIRIKSYEVLLQNYFNPERTFMALFPAAMRYAGPREAVFHAIVRKNYGCTHFIVGRDHAGVSKPDGSPYYGPYDAQEIFERFSEEEIGIHLFFYDNAFYCRRCEAIVTEKSAPVLPEQRFVLSGTKVRDLLRAGLRPPSEITRPEIADVLINALKERQREQEATRGIDI